MVSSSKSKEDRQKEKLLSQVRKNNKPKDWFVILVTAGVMALIAAITIFLVIQNNQETEIISSTKSSSVSPKNAANDGFTITKAGLTESAAYKNSTTFESEPYSSEKTNISMYIDYACHNCAEFEEENLPQIQGWLDSGEIDSFSIRPMAFLSPYSVEAANAASCVAEYDPNNFLKAHSAMTLAYEDSPSGKRLIAVLKEAGVNTSLENLTSCILGEQFNKFVEAATKRAQSGPIPETSLASTVGIKGTPTVFINGEQYAGNPDKTVFASFVSYIKQGGTTAEIAESSENQVGGK